MYLDQPQQWDRLAALLADPGNWPLGLDSETYGQPEKVSPAWRARVQCWSVAIRSQRRHPRGYRLAVGRVLPAAALDHPGLRAVLEDPAIPKLAHNAPHDHHALANMGVAIAGLTDTLQWARVALPGLLAYGLKDLEVAVLGKPERPRFKDVVGLRYTEVIAIKRLVKRCSCGVPACRKRKGHTKYTFKVFSPFRVEKVRERDVAEMMPGCPGWEAWVNYALIDAVSVLELAEVLEHRRPLEVSYPW